MDRTTKVLLAGIAAGLWANALMPLLKPPGAAAQDMSAVERSLRSIDSSLDSIESDIDDLEDGTCSNKKLC